MTGFGPRSFFEAAMRSSFIAEMQRAKTASPMSVIGMPNSAESITVHLPVPFWPAVSRIFSTSGSPSLSLKARISRVISMRYESRSPSFHSANTLCISSALMPRLSFMRWYASQMSCMSPYSMPLCTILT